MNTFSFYWSHQLSAVEGGMVLTDDDGLADTCRLLRNHGWRRGYDNFDDEFRFEIFGFNLRPLELHAAIARVQLRKLENGIRLRTHNYDHWKYVTQGFPIEYPRLCGRPSLFGIHFCVEFREVRDNIVRGLRENGIDCRPPCAGSFRRQVYGQRWSDQKTPVADRIHDCGIMIGLPPFEASVQISGVANIIAEIFNGG
jgi:CDP-6-deoxy-D-xylo-4-hexulose-3-dehydrase